MGQSVLADQARDFARRYVMLVEALRSEGVTEDVARSEARLAATTLLQVDRDASRACTVCGAPVTAP